MDNQIARSSVEGIVWMKGDASSRNEEVGGKKTDDS